MTKFLLIDNQVINLEHLSKASYIENCRNPITEEVEPALTIYMYGDSEPSEVFTGDAALQLWAMLKDCSLHVYKTTRAATVHK